MSYDNELSGKQNQQERVKLLDDIFNTYGTIIGENFIKKVLMVYSCPSARGWKNNGNSTGCTQQANAGNSNCLTCWSKALARNHYLKDKAAKGGAASMKPAKIMWIRKNGVWTTRIYYADGTFVFATGKVWP